MLEAMSKNYSVHEFSRFIRPGAFNPWITSVHLSASAIMQVLYSPEWQDARSLYSVAIPSLGGHLVMFLTFLLVGKMLKPRFSVEPMKFSWVIGIAIGVVLGLERVVVGWVTAQIHGTWLGFQSLNTATVFISITVSTIVTLSGLTVGSAVRGFLEAQQNLLALNSRQNSGMQEIPDEVQGFVNKALVEVSQLPKELRWGHFRSVVRRIISNELRPLSHKLWKIEDQKLKNFSLRFIFHRAITFYCFRTQIVVPIWFLTTLPIDLYLLGFSPGLEIAVIEALWLLALLVFASHIKTTSTSAQVAKLVLTVLVFGLSRPLIEQALLGLEYQTIEPRFALTSMIWATQLIISVGMSWALFESVTEVRSQLARMGMAPNPELSPAIGSAFLQRRLLAHHLHGQVQSDLRSLINGLETDDKIVHDDLISRIELVLQSALHPSKGYLTSRKEFEESFLAQWGAFIEVNFEFRPTEIALTSEIWSLVAGVAAEGAANAVRHGFASSVKISIVHSDRDLIISIRDDGSGPRQGLSGMGTQFFSAVSNEWSLKGTGSGSQLRLFIPLH